MGQTVRRREFITLVGGAMAAWPLAARAQQPERLRRIGVLIPTREDDPDGQQRVALLRQGLSELGWIEGQNVFIDRRFAAGDIELLRKSAVELVMSTWMSS